MAVEENKAVIRRLFDEIYNDQNLDVLNELVADDVVNHSPPKSTSTASRASGTSWSEATPPPPTAAPS